MNRPPRSPLDLFVLRAPDAPQVASITLNSPPRRNAFGLAMRERLLAVFEDLMFRQDNCRAVVLSAAGGAFRAGGDISERQERTRAQLRECNRLPLRSFALLAEGLKPGIAAVEGAAMVAGTGCCGRGPWMMDKIGQKGLLDLLVNNAAAIFAAHMQPFHVMQPMRIGVR